MRKPPAYRRRAGYAQALVTLTDARTKRRRDYWLGEYGSPASRQRYYRLIAEWEARGRRLPTDTALTGDAASPGDFTITHLVHEYWEWARSYYGPADQTSVRLPLRLLRTYYGQLPAAEFGPRKLRLLRDEMIRGDALATPPRKPWTRKFINRQMGRMRHVFKWAASREWLPVATYQALCTVESLRRGRTAARETERVGPAPRELIDAARPWLSEPVRALLELQLLTGARPGELLSLRPCDLEMGDDPEVWIYALVDHKNAHRGQRRAIYFGPRAQEVLRPFLRHRPTDAYLFSPAEADAARRAQQHAVRKTPLSCGNRPGTNRRTQPKCQPGDRYSISSYRRSLQHACAKAFPLPAHLQQREDETRAQWRARLTKAEREEVKAWRRAHRFHPYQLRHNAATELRREFGLEAAQLTLGHASAQITDAVYAERDRAKVIEIMRKIG